MQLLQLNMNGTEGDALFIHVTNQPQTHKLQPIISTIKILKENL